MKNFNNCSCSFNQLIKFGWPETGIRHSPECIKLNEILSDKKVSKKYLKVSKKHLKAVDGIIDLFCI